LFAQLARDDLPFAIRFDARPTPKILFRSPDGGAQILLGVFQVAIN
jgi:hypothetical protein